MKSKRMLAAITAAIFFTSLTACAGAQVREKTGNVPEQQKSARQLKFEQDEQSRSLIVEGAGAFIGLVIGGLVGILASKQQTAITSALLGCVIGGAAGYVLGLVVFNNTKPGDVTADDRKIKEYFEDYRNIQLKQ